MAQGKCCGVIEESVAAVHEKRERRRSAQPWLIRKFMIVITLGILGYAAYVYIGRFCVPMIERRNGAGASRDTGIALLVVFAVLYLWVLWAYLTVIITPPGYAKDHVAKSDRPLIPANIPLIESRHSNSLTLSPDIDMELGHRDQRLSNPSNIERRLAGPSYEDLMKRDSSQGPSIDVLSNSSANVIQRLSASEIQPSNSLRSNIPSTIVESSSSQGKPKLAFGHKLKLQKVRAMASSTNTPVFQSDERLEKAQRREARLKARHIDRRPPTTAVLQPLHRYCLIEGFVKPYRTHHCRSCGTCVLKYDHHCPWIGQCVGARNHKFFLNFCEAASVFSCFVFTSLLAIVIRISLSNKTGNPDPQEIAILILAGLFMLFTCPLVISHVRMILRGTTTVESMQIQSMHMREDRLLGEVYSWWEFGAKARKLREWDRDWGALSTEGNIWWKGDRHTEWVDVMGDWWLGWIFPVGRGKSDGLTYPVNPRFDAEGRWRRRSEWPEELR